MLKRLAFPRLVSGCLLVMGLIGSAGAVSLISDEEAAMPDDPVKTRAGISRGPKILLINPAATAGLIRSPFNLRIRFESHGGTKIDTDSIVITYKKRPAIDLTQRMKAFIQPTGVSVDNAEMPPGEHRIRLDVKDTENQSGSAEFTIKVSK